MLYKLKNYFRYIVEFNYVEFFTSLKNFITDGYKQFLSDLKNTRKKLNDLSKSNYELGVYHYNEGNLSDSIMRFKICLLFKCRFSVKIYYYLTCIHVELNEITKAKKYLELYKNSGDSEFKKNILYLEELILLSEGKNCEVNELPRCFLDRKYNRLAKENALFEFELQGLDKFAEIFAKFKDEKKEEKESKKKEKKFENALHVGCKYGDLGNFLATENLVEDLIGVEQCKKMADIAKGGEVEGTKSYYKVHCAYIDEFFNKNKIVELQDLIIIDGVLGYYKNIESIIQSCFKLLNKGGLCYVFMRDCDDTQKFNYKNEEFCHTIKSIRGECEKYAKFLGEEKFEVSEDRFSILTFKK